MAFAAGCNTLKVSSLTALLCNNAMGMPFHMTLVSHSVCSVTRVWISPIQCSPCAVSLRKFPVQVSVVLIMHYKHVMCKHSIDISVPTKHHNTAQIMMLHEVLSYFSSS